MVQTVFQAGNSSVVAIPRQLLQEMGLSVGQKVTVDKVDDETIVVKKATEKPVRKTDPRTSREFQKWLRVFTKENAEILDELAER